MQSDEEFRASCKWNDKVDVAGEAKVFNEVNFHLWQKTHQYQGTYLASNTFAHVVGCKIFGT